MMRLLPGSALYILSKGKILSVSCGQAEAFSLLSKIMYLLCIPLPKIKCPIMPFHNEISRINKILVFTENQIKNLAGARCLVIYSALKNNKSTKPYRAYRNKLFLKYQFLLINGINARPIYCNIENIAKTMIING